MNYEFCSRCQLANETPMSPTSAFLSPLAAPRGGPTTAAGAADDPAKQLANLVKKVLLVKIFIDVFE